MKVQTAILGGNDDCHGRAYHVISVRNADERAGFEAAIRGWGGEVLA